MIFSPDVLAISGALGISLALWSIQRRRQARGMDADAATSDQWLLIFSVVLMLAGVWGWLMPTTSAVSGL